MTTPHQPPYIRIEDESIPIDGVSKLSICPSPTCPGHADLTLFQGNRWSSWRTFTLPTGTAHALHTTIQDAINSRDHLNEDRKPDPRQPAETCATELNSRPHRRLVRVGANIRLSADDVVSIQLKANRTIKVYLRGDFPSTEDGGFYEARFDDELCAKLTYNQALKDWSGSEEYSVELTRYS